MYVYIYICIYIYIYSRTHIHTHTHTHTHSLTYSHTRTHTHTHAHAHAHTHSFTHICTHAYVCICMYIQNSVESRHPLGMPEFHALLQRVQNGNATVVLRKPLLCNSVCNVMQEIWIRDAANPDALQNPLKSYAVLTVFYQASVSRISDVKPEHLEIVVAINCRHLALRGPRYCADNPFFNTFIESTGGDTLKVFPKKETWKCGKCGLANFMSKPFCRGHGIRGPCSGVRVCTAWHWKKDKSQNKGLACILALADDLTAWQSGSGKSRVLD